MNASSSFGSVALQTKPQSKQAKLLNFVPWSMESAVNLKPDGAKTPERDVNCNDV